MLLLLLPTLALVGISAVHGQYCTPTTAATEGPYYKAGAPFRNGNTICDWQRVRNGTQLMVQGRVYGAGCRSGQYAVLDVWSADPSGNYSPRSGSDYTCRGKLVTDASGNYRFLTVIPGRYPQGGSYRPAHIHFKVSRSNQTRNTLTTQLYFQNDPYIYQDPCGSQSCHAGDPTLTFALQPQNGQSYMIRFDVILR